MNRWITAGLGTAAAVALTLGAAGAAFAGSDDDDRRLQAVGLTADQQLVTFAVDKPGRVRTAGKVTGLQSDTRLVGVDYRVQDGKLYGVGDAGGVYTLVVRGAKATKVSQLAVALNGTSFGVDFNPAADRLRIVSDTGQNLRHDVNAGGTTVADATLTIPPATTPATGVTAVAYTNNDLSPDTATTLFDLDTTLDQIAVQAPANAGLLSPTGKLGVDAGAEAGFDIYTDADATGFAALQVGGRNVLYRISLLSGRADQLGRFPATVTVTDLALPLGQS
ncbi:DUF4394 domain-containing protein [Actinoplanes aureus]|uniref:DUF4394 domain-containing protein n=1 Tax=Actinoplanes aureus TaxID=2792083 RepID=A0A931C8D0_9ACTN|nr:DUF4394 domain-containing protein [Actinoplanes aureus]MBG0562806.1 DUF4394 domain-containing protein [Actinoplanes aureus]